MLTATRLVLLMLLSAASLLSAAEDKKSGPPEITVPKLTQAAPKIDGTLDDAAWKDAAKSTPLVRTYGEASSLQCTFRILQDDKNLYIAVDCPETDSGIKALKLDVTEHDGDPIWDDDCIELFIDPSGKRDFPYYQIIINPKSVTFDVQMNGNGDPDKGWDPKYEAKAQIGKSGWTAEFALPFAMFDRTEKSADEWTFNLAHSRSAGEALYWAPVHDESSHQPAKFGKLKGIAVRALK
ncbi:MAG TPA: sugar-binding protein [Planctomycetota bacterium]|nr:sugar-binding protein [Planctomycetota bacterium]